MVELVVLPEASLASAIVLCLLLGGPAFMLLWSSVFLAMTFNVEHEQLQAQVQHEAMKDVELSIGCVMCYVQCVRKQQEVRGLKLSCVLSFCRDFQRLIGL